MINCSDTLLKFDQLYNQDAELSNEVAVISWVLKCLMPSKEIRKILLDAEFQAVQTCWHHLVGIFAVKGSNIYLIILSVPSPQCCESVVFR